MSQFTNRVLRAVRLDPNLYEEVEADRGALGQAMTLVVLSSLAAGLAEADRGGLGWIVLGTGAALAGWVFWAYLTYLIGTKIMPEPQTRSDVGELLRTIGFASAPGLVRVFGVLPGLHRAAFFVAGVWTVLAMVVAVRQALDYESTARAAGVCIIAWVIQGVVVAFLVTMFGGLS